MALIVFLILSVAGLVIAVLHAEIEDDPPSPPSPRTGRHPSNIKWDDEAEYKGKHHWRGDDE
jgi:hypothetical protein